MLWVGADKSTVKAAPVFLSSCFNSRVVVLGCFNFSASQLKFMISSWSIFPGRRYYSTVPRWLMSSYLPRQPPHSVNISLEIWLKAEENVSVEWAHQILECPLFTDLNLAWSWRLFECSCRWLRTTLSWTLLRATWHSNYCENEKFPLKHETTLSWISSRKTSTRRRNFIARNSLARLRKRRSKITL